MYFFKYSGLVLLFIRFKRVEFSATFEKEYTDLNISV